MALIREGFEKHGENRYSCQKKVHFSNHENKWPRGAKILPRRKTCSSFFLTYASELCSKAQWIKDYFLPYLEEGVVQEKSLPNPSEFGTVMAGKQF